ncbi:hypothetical protein ONE63_005259 [Megalurothrips usitatus]|uniref:Endoplasmic reticulum-Golgi intermediate compartment protein 3 n=1 Tax=Megalurothrips usitatus TaxID=439358 RepID=A0AAV7XZS4_9NEOP|nr:hypothetical protein ONE63_005259 [Megalurothrips usitatus]
MSVFKNFDALRRFDSFSKTIEDFRVKTSGGGLVTLLSVGCMLVLFYAEVKDYMTPGITEDLFVDTSRGPKLRINLDIVMPTISCPFLSLDAMDTAGEHHLHIDHNVYKRRLDLLGQPLEDPQKENLQTSTSVKTSTESSNITKSLEKKNDTCGSCYGAPKEVIKCCNSCEDVREAYRIMQWKFPDPDDVEQCKNDQSRLAAKGAFKEGCQIYGYLEVNRVGGSFHIAPGRSYLIDHVHVHDVQPFSASSFNTTHTIRHLSFGLNIQGKTNPIDGIYVTTPDGATMFQYYIKIVPTTYVRRDGSVLQTNQFSVTKHQKVVSMGHGESGMPGIFFNYELSPMMVKYTEKEKPLSHFLVNLCAIIGGIYTVASIIDGILYHSYRAIQQKIEIGKIS